MKNLVLFKYLAINRECSIDALCTLIPYTSQFYHLSLNDLSESDNSDSGIVLLFTLFNLTYLSIEKYNITFDDLERFIMKSKCNLKVLHIIFFLNLVLCII